MCQIITIEGVDYETQGEIKKVLGPIIYTKGTPDGAKNNDSDCLCWVDVLSMADREGLIHERVPFGWEVFRPVYC